MKIRVWLILMMGFGWGILLFLAKTSYAINSSGLGIYPNQSEWNSKNEATKSWFIYTLNPGEIKKSKVDIKNDSDQPVDLKIYPVEATTTKDGSFAPQSEDAIKNGVGSWINMSVNGLTLNPKEIKTVDFIITVPQNAEPGDHMGAIIIQNNKTERNTSVQIINRLGARIYITVPGEKNNKLEIETFDKTMDKGKVVFQLTLANQGNTRITPKGEIEIKNKAGYLIDKIDLTQREVFPKSTIVLPTKWEGTINGKFTVLATVKYDDQILTKDLNLEINDTEKKVLGVQTTKREIKELPLMASILTTILLLTIVYRFL
jgi:hypothetical protein